MNREELDRRRTALARRISEVEGVPLQEAFRLVPVTEAEIRRVVDRLNGLHGGDKSQNGQKIARATKRSEKTGESFGTAARFTR